MQDITWNKKNVPLKNEGFCKLLMYNLMSFELDGLEQNNLCNVTNRHTTGTQGDLLAYLKGKR